MKSLFTLILSLFLFTGLVIAQESVNDIETNSGTNYTLPAGVKWDNVSRQINNPISPNGAMSTLLYDNGPAFNVPGGGPGGADLSLLENTALGMSTLGFGHQFTVGNRMADEFTVPAGETWTIDSLIFYAYQTGSTTTSTMTGVYFQIWDGDPAGAGTVVFGDLTTNRISNTYWSNIYRHSETSPGSTRPIMRNVCGTSGLVLTEGTYWIDWMTDGSLASGPWAPPIAILGNNTTGNAQQYIASTMTWGPALDTGSSTPQGMPFEVWGTMGGAAGGLMLISDNTTGTNAVEEWLIALGEPYTRFTNTAAVGMPTSDWLMYDAVLYIGTTSTGAELDSSTAYVAAGGNLLVADNDEGYFAGSSSLFLDYLMATYVSDAGSDGFITGLEMMAGVDMDISADPYPDDVTPNTGAFGTGVPIFLAPTTTTYAGMRGDGGSFRTTLLCWDPQYGDSATSVVMMSRVIAWLVDGIIPVELSSFTASVNDRDVTLSWETATELNNSGFEVERNAGAGFEKVGFVPGFGTTTEPRSYSFTDAGLSSGTYSYRLKQIDLDGSYEYSDAVEVEVLTPDVFALNQNYPNPFNPSTKITFSLAVDSKVSLRIFDALGQEITTLVNEDLSAGIHNIDFNAEVINSGVYFYKIEATGANGTQFVDVKKMMFLK